MAVAAGPSAADVERIGVAGGLCVEIGLGSAEFAAELAKTGRFLVQSLDGDAAVVARVQETLRAQAVYGLASAVRLDPPKRLPYSEDMVNLVVLGDATPGQVELAEVVRVLSPGGIVLAPAGQASPSQLEASGLKDLGRDKVREGWIAGRKPRPTGMDEWTHPLHGADGNTVSQDRLVGPPRRVRWVTGPADEISSMVTAAGRNFYGGVWARDAFNGLRLWKQDLRPSPAQGGFEFRYTNGSVRPIAVGDELLVCTGDLVQALDGATGKTLRTYTDAGRPRTLMHSQGVLIAVGSKEIRALDVASARLLWKQDIPESRHVVATEEAVFLMTGNARQGEKVRAVCLDLRSGKMRWQRDDHPWLGQARRIVAHADLAVFEVSTLGDTKEGNAIHVVSAADGEVRWSRSFVPGMNHMKQARAMFLGKDLWILEHLKCVALDPQTGEVRKSHRAGLCHCFPPVATARFMFSGEMDLTDLDTGEVDALQITKAHCGRDAGWVPANGLIYNSPKHCVCWPMLRGYSALAPESSTSTVDEVVEQRRFRLEKGVALPESPAADAGDWPCYRHDAWRSGGTDGPAPGDLNQLWATNLGGLPEGEITQDWRENPFVRGPITAPVAAAGLVYVARPDAHEVVALELTTGAVGWRFTADGRVDTPPTIHRGLCLFGTRSGSVYGLRADDGRMVWRMRAAPSDEQIVAYGQIESPWPVPGSVLVIDDVAYFAAGRQPLADGGVLLFAADPATGQVRWVKRLDKLPMTNFYACVGMEFDNFDLLHREGEQVAMSRWLFNRGNGEMVVKAAEMFAKPNTSGGVVLQRGVWTYAPRQSLRFDKSDLRPRPLAVFQKNILVGSLHDQRTIYRRDFDPETVEKFNVKWMTGWAAGENLRKKEGEAWPVERLAKDVKWSAPILQNSPADRRIAAMVLAGDRLVAAATDGPLYVLSLVDGSVVAQAQVPSPLWDGVAVAKERLVVATADGQVVCLGKR